MSVRWMSRIWDRDDLTQSETLVGLALADHADEDGRCWPSIDRIAQKSRLKRRATQNVIKRLELIGLISVERSVGRRNTNCYTFHDQQKGAPNAPLFESEKVHPGTEKVHLDDIKGAAATAPESPRTINEPSGRAKRPRTSKADKPSRRCPQEFQVNGDLMAWAKREHPGVDLGLETAKFRDWEFAHARSDWSATWRNWIRKAAESQVGRRRGEQRRADGLVV